MAVLQQTTKLVTILRDHSGALELLNLGGSGHVFVLRSLYTPLNGNAESTEITFQREAAEALVKALAAEMYPDQSSNPYIR